MLCGEKLRREVVVVQEFKIPLEVDKAEEEDNAMEDYHSAGQTSGSGECFKLSEVEQLTLTDESIEEMPIKKQASMNAKGKGKKKDRQSEEKEKGKGRKKNKTNEKSPDKTTKNTRTQPPKTIASSLNHNFKKILLNTSRKKPLIESAVGGLHDSDTEDTPPVPSKTKVVKSNVLVNLNSNEEDVPRANKPMPKANLVKPKPIPNPKVQKPNTATSASGSSVSSQASSAAPSH
uniref:Uncharacterized protein n=1 Tax=Moniliophthora roreri TaxID=221103 RepID=A0A0W0F6I9_MONRR